MLKIQTDKNSLQDFGKTLAIILFLLSHFWGYKEYESASKYLLYAAFLFSFLSIFFPRSIKYFYIYWIKAANFISLIVTKVILFLVYYFFVTPYSLMVKFFRRDLLDKGIDIKKTSYWKAKPKNPINLDRYKRQF